MKAFPLVRSEIPVRVRNINVICVCFAFVATSTSVAVLPLPTAVATTLPNTAAASTGPAAATALIIRSHCSYVSTLCFLNVDWHNPAEPRRECLKSDQTKTPRPCQSLSGSFGRRKLCGHNACIHKTDTQKHLIDHLLLGKSLAYRSTIQESFPCAW